MAKKQKLEYKQIKKGLQEIYSNGKLIGYYSASHRGGFTWKLGMKLFDPKWKMPKTHPDYKKYEAKAKRSEFSNGEVESGIPFNERGSKTIKTMADAKKAAERFYQYMC